MTKEKKEYTNYAFYWGSIIGFATFVWYLIGFFTDFEKKVIFGDIYFFIEVSLILWMFLRYRRMQEDKKLKFGRMMYMAFITSLIIAGFYAIYFVVRMTKLDPLFFSNYVYEASKAMKSIVGIDYASLINKQNIGIVKVSFIISLYFSSVFNTMIYALIVAGVIKFNERFYFKQ